MVIGMLHIVSRLLLLLLIPWKPLKLLLLSIILTTIKLARIFHHSTRMRLLKALLLSNTLTRILLRVLIPSLLGIIPLLIRVELLTVLLLEVVLPWSWYTVLITRIELLLLWVLLLRVVPPLLWVAHRLRR